MGASGGHKTKHAVSIEPPSFSRVETTGDVNLYNELNGKGHKELQQFLDEFSNVFALFLSQYRFELKSV